MSRAEHPKAEIEHFIQAIGYCNLKNDQFALGTNSVTAHFFRQAARSGHLSEMSIIASLYAALYYLSPASHQNIVEILNKQKLPDILVTITYSVSNVLDSYRPSERPRISPYQIVVPKDLSTTKKYHPHYNDPSEIIEIATSFPKFQKRIDASFRVQKKFRPRYMHQIDDELWKYALNHQLLPSIIKSGFITQEERELLYKYFVFNNSEVEPSEDLVVRFSQGVANTC